MYTRGIMLKESKTEGFATGTMRHHMITTKKCVIFVVAVFFGFMFIAMTNPIFSGPTNITDGKVLQDMQIFTKLPVRKERPPERINNKGRLPTKVEPNKTSSELQSMNQTPKPKVWTHPDQNPDYWKRRKERVTPLDFNFLITSNICDKGPTHLLIMVISMASHRSYRYVIRETWGSVNRNNTWAGEPLSRTVRLVFLFGLTANESETISLRKEAAAYNDIVLADFKEDYFNLTYKVLMGFKWAKDYCGGAEYIMKNDEDSVVHVPWLLERLESSEWNSNIIGPYFTNQRRYTDSKFAVSSDYYPFNIYPPHVKGNIYVMARHTSLQILEVSEYMPYVNMEDVHITGILAKVIGATHRGIPMNEYNPYTRPQLCDLAKRKKFAGRDVSVSYARDIWRKILDPKQC